jgi:beta-phosphoglucomutase
MIRLGDTKAAIFDMDGTMVNNNPFQRDAWAAFCKERWGITLTEQMFCDHVLGRNNATILTRLLQREFSPEEVAELADQKERLYRVLYDPYICEVPGLSALLKDMRRLSIRLAVASLAPPLNRAFTFEKLSIPPDHFEVIVGEEDVVNGKPDPEIYLQTLQRLGLPAEACIAFEDSPAGIEAAKAAGIRTIGVHTYHKPEELEKADYLVADFREVRRLFVGL